MATYVGYDTAGIFGGIIATLGTILPAIVIVSIVSGCLEKFNGNPFVGYAFYPLTYIICIAIPAAAAPIMINTGEMPVNSVKANVAMQRTIPKASLICLLWTAPGGYGPDSGSRV